MAAAQRGQSVGDQLFDAILDQRPREAAEPVDQRKFCGPMGVAMA
jgi:hypothetical protein